MSCTVMTVSWICLGGEDIVFLCLAGYAWCLDSVVD